MKLKQLLANNWNGDCDKNCRFFLFFVLFLICVFDAIFDVLCLFLLYRLFKVRLMKKVYVNYNNVFCFFYFTILSFWISKKERNKEKQKKRTRITKE